MAEPTFFYGSFMNLDVRKQSGFVPERYEVAKLSGFDIRSISTGLSGHGLGAQEREGGGP